MGTGVLFTGAKWPRSEFDHSPLTSASSADVKNEWICNSTPPIRLHDVDRGNFTFNHLFLRLINCLFPLLMAGVFLKFHSPSFDRLTYGENCELLAHLTYLRTYLFTYLLTYLLHGAESFLTLRSLTLYIYGAPILDVSRSHTTTQHSR